MKVLVGNRLPRVHLERGRRLEQHIPLLGNLVGGKHQIARTQHARLPHGAQRRGDLPKPVVGVGVLHPNGTHAAAKLRRHQAEGEDVAHPLQLPPCVNFHIIKVESRLRVGIDANINAGRIGAQVALFIEINQFPVFVTPLGGQGHIVHQNIVAHPDGIFHRAVLGDMAQHLPFHLGRLVGHQIREVERDGKGRIGQGDTRIQPVQARRIGRNQIHFVPKEIGEVGNDCRGFVDGQRGLLSHPLALHAAIDAEIIKGGVGIGIRLTLVGVVVRVEHGPARRLLTVEKHRIFGIENAVIGTLHIEGHFRQVVVTRF